MRAAGARRWHTDVRESGGGRTAEYNRQSGPRLDVGPNGGGGSPEAGSSALTDSRKSVGLTTAPLPGSVSQALFVGERCDFDCVESEDTCNTKLDCVEKTYFTD